MLIRSGRSDGKPGSRSLRGSFLLCAASLSLFFFVIGSTSGGDVSQPPQPDGARAYAGMTISRKAPDGNRFLGSKACASCHEDYYRGWEKTFHSTVIQDARTNPGAILADFTEEGLPFTREEVEYTIGSHWDQRYMKRIDDEYYVLPRLWSVQSKEWRPYSVWSWKKKPYSRYCAGCHTTFIDPEKRTIAEEGIGCEACHGPGGLHVDGGGRADRIVNPEKLTRERANMICSSCHVRGQDTSGEYYYPVGYIPGADLAEYYTPLEIQEGETAKAALNRLYGDWKDKMLNSSRAKCEVCGIAGQDTDTPKDNAQSDMEFCFGCHNFRAKLQLHNRHPDTVDLVCYDCHVKKADDLSKGMSGSIHSYSYFLVHTENCYDPEIEKACAKCHDDETDPVAWARNVMLTWKRPVVIDH
ncbi:MAG: hypothetical protein JSV26_05015 [bacterium]|nr:MAG: hypothetical protein JSV26_05015 [bacterium]